VKVFVGSRRRRPLRRRGPNARQRRSRPVRRESSVKPDWSRNGRSNVPLLESRRPPVAPNGSRQPWRPRALAS